MFPYAGYQTRAAHRARVIEWAEENRPESTRRAYAIYRREYLEFSRTQGLSPADGVTLASFVMHAVTTRTRRLGRNTVCKVIPAAVADIYRYDPSIRPTADILVGFAKKTAARVTAAPKA